MACHFSPTSFTIFPQLRHITPRLRIYILTKLDCEFFFITFFKIKMDMGEKIIDAFTLKD